MKKLLRVQSLILAIGTLFAWYNVTRDFSSFYRVEGTIFKIRNCLIPNPVTQACFYGAIAFLLAFVWSIIILRSEKVLSQQRYLWWLLGAGTIFAWFNVAREFIAFYSIRSGPALGCSAVPIVNPFLTPCFTGASIFLLAAVLAGVIYSRSITSSKQNSKALNSWYVITGGPSSGKTTTVNLLKQRGYATTVERARHYIDTQLVAGKSTEEIRQNQLLFQQKVLDLQIAQELSLDPQQIVFLDRAIPDTLAYYRFLKLAEDEKLEHALKRASYKKVFILSPLPLVKDYARTEDDAAQKHLHKLITQVYESLPFPVIHVPLLPPEQRVDFIVARL